MVSNYQTMAFCWNSLVCLPKMVSTEPWCGISGVRGLGRRQSYSFALETKNSRYGGRLTCGAPTTPFAPPGCAGSGVDSAGCVGWEVVKPLERLPKAPKDAPGLTPSRGVQTDEGVPPKSRPNTPDGVDGGGGACEREVKSSFRNLILSQSKDAD